jgi:hypothetical protein
MGYVLKDSDFSEIMQAIQNAMDGKRYLSKTISSEVLELLLNADADKKDLQDVLSAREREVLQHIAEGNTNAVIDPLVSAPLERIVPISWRKCVSTRKPTWYVMPFNKVWFPCEQT